MGISGKRSPEELYSIIRKVEGFLYDGEAYLLYEKAFGLRPGGVIAEIGSYCGKSTVCMALGLKDGGNKNARIYAIDPFGGSSEHGSIDTFPRFKDNIRNAGVEEFITPVKASSEEAYRKWDLTRNIDLLWIDGGHEYEYVAEDINLWLKLVIEGGVIALHDTSGRFYYGGFVGVRRALKEILFKRECLKDYGFVNATTYARKSHSITQKEAWERWKAYMCWWTGEVVLYPEARGFGMIKFSLVILSRYLKRIPKFIRKPWVLLMDESKRW